MDYLKWAQETFQNDIYATKTTGIVIEDVKLNYAKCSLTIEQKHYNANNSVMGGAIFTLADFTFAVAANTEVMPTVSLTSQISYLSAAKGTKLTAEAKCTKNGRNVCFYQIAITDNLGVSVANIVTTGYKNVKNKA